MSYTRNKAMQMVFIEIENDFDRSFKLIEGYVKSTLSNLACMYHG